MFCKNCGRQIDDNAVICPHCGTSVSGNPNNSQPQAQSRGNGIAIVGFVFAFFIPLVGLICSILGFNKASKEGLPYKGLALAGIIISVVVWVLFFIISITILPDIMV